MREFTLDYSKMEEEKRNTFKTPLPEPKLNFKR
jgi:hypothetical protein